MIIFFTHFSRNLPVEFCSQVTENVTNRATDAKEKVLLLLLVYISTLPFSSSHFFIFFHTDLFLQATNAKENVLSKTKAVKDSVNAVKEIVGGKKKEIKSVDIKSDQGNCIFLMYIHVNVPNNVKLLNCIGNVSVSANVDPAHPGATVAFTNTQLPVTTTVSVQSNPSKK